MRFLFLLVVLLLSNLSCRKGENRSVPADKPSEQTTVNLTVDGIARSFILYLPEGYSSTEKMPMIFVIHGGSGTPEGMMTLANFTEIANRDKVVLVYPSGIQKNWNDGRPTTPNQLGINDVNFFNQMCDHQ